MAKISVFERIEQLQKIAEMIEQNERYVANDQWLQSKAHNLYSKDYFAKRNEWRKKVDARLKKYLSNKANGLAVELSIKVELPAHNEANMLKVLSTNCDVSEEITQAEHYIRGIFYSAEFFELRING
jgi:hypothetical protein